MNSYSPSYLFKNRFGIYYFRCRIPLDIRRKHNLSKVEIRKSLGTGNRTEALRLSRILWVKLENNGFMLHDWEIEAEKQEYDNVEGKRLLKEFLISQIKSKETGILEDEDIDAFFSDEHFNESETSIFFRKVNNQQEELLKKHLDIYSDLPLEKRKKILLKLKAEIDQNESINQLEHQDKNIVTEDFADRVANRIQQAGKKKLTKIGLQEAFENYISDGSKVHNWKDVDKHIVDIRIFIDVIGLDKCSDICIDDIIKYRDVMINLPYRYDIDKDCMGLSYEEMSKLPNKKHASPNTLVNKFGVIKNFLRWCEDSNYIDVDFEKPFRVVKKSKKAKKNRVPYKPDELKRLFNSKQYIQGTHKNAARHWVLLIALFTGARLNEICQLHKSNVVKDSDSGIWYFDFNDYSEDRGGKTDSMIRFVPVHSQLRKLGFFRYYDSIPEESRLFPMLRKKDRSYGTAISKFFNVTYKNKKNCNIEVPEGVMKDFHSFRNTIINTMKQSGIPVASAREVVGHEDEDMSYGGYADPLDLPNRKKIIEKVKYPSIDWSLVKEREWNKKL